MSNYVFISIEGEREAERGGERGKEIKKGEEGVSVGGRLLCRAWRPQVSTALLSQLVIYECFCLPHVAICELLRIRCVGGVAQG